MKILILGGTLFLGRHLVEAALAAGHQVTLFNRGRQNPALFAQVEQLRGDRGAKDDRNDMAADGGANVVGAVDAPANLTALQGRQFDAVIDTSGYYPRQMQRMADALGPDLPYYLFISTISVYAAFAPGLHYDETAPLASGLEGYGALKARCEESIAAAYPGKVAIVRPGLIVGPHDPTDRFTYWPRRLAQGGMVLAPGRPERPVQWIDARDLAAWCIHLVQQQVVGSFNASGPAAPCNMGQLLETCRQQLCPSAQLAWLDDARLQAQQVQAWTELPLWIPEQDPEHGGMLLADNRAALAAGLTLRPLAQTVADTLAWDRLEAQPHRVPERAVATLTPQRESALLALEKTALTIT
ncbi:MAG: hypothetical protein RL748_4136 [Pseudomonadota bacterium]|jgi:2'-hydroxyisoflavone reductase